VRPILNIGHTSPIPVGGEYIREMYLDNWKERMKGAKRILRNDDEGILVLETIVTFIVLVIAVMVLVIVLSNLWGTFTGALTNYSTNETTFGPTVKSITPLLIGVAVLLVILALVFGMKVFKEGGFFA
jgi:small-conductance mechanosensitive channel